MTVKKSNRSQIMLKNEGMVNVKCYINVKELEGQKDLVARTLSSLGRSGFDNF